MQSSCSGLLAISVLLASLGDPTPASAAVQQGYRIVRIPDGAGPGTCIQPTDKVTATLRRIVFEKKSSWLGLITDNSIDVTFTLTLKGSDSGSDPKSASFAKVVSESVAQYGTGQISFADEQGLLNQFALTDKNGNVFNQLNLQIGVVRTKGKSVGAQILENAVAATKDLPLPANPYSPIYNAATTYVNNVFEPVLQQAASAKEAVTHNIVMNIDASGCSSDDERTGTIAIVDEPSNPGATGYVDINDIDANRYCFRAQLTPAFAVQFAPLPATKNCAQAAGFADLQNSYLGIVVNAVAATKVPGQQSVGITSSHLFGVNLRGLALPSGQVPSWTKSGRSDSALAKRLGTSERAIRLYREGLRRCEANGLEPSKCL